jgi:hypothetical protein
VRVGAGVVSRGTHGLDRQRVFAATTPVRLASAAGSGLFMLWRFIAVYSRKE